MTVNKSKDVLHRIWKGMIHRAGCPDAPRFLWRTDIPVGEPMTVFEFIADDGSVQQVQGRCRGLGPIAADLQDNIDPIGLWDNDGTYYVIHIDTEAWGDRPTFCIGDAEFHHPVLKFITTDLEVDPSTGRPVEPGPRHYPGRGDLDRIDPRGEFGPDNAHWVQRAVVGKTP